MVKAGRAVPTDNRTHVLAINGSAILHRFNGSDNGSCGRSAVDRGEYRQAAGAIKAGLD